ncbi:MAG: P-type conjugative transfer protein TrbG [Burkholderia sp.]
MEKKTIAAILAAAFAVNAHAKIANPDIIDYGTSVMQEAKNWQTMHSAKPVRGQNGLILFPFGQYQPTLVCAPLRACDIQLEPGEIVTEKPKLGDKVRWIISKGMEGEKGNEITHVIVKPTDYSIETNMLILTNRRTYSLTLKSLKGDSYVSRIGWYYPDDINKSWEADAERQRRDQEKVVSDFATVSPDKINFDYKIKGNRQKWTPVRVFDDGVRVYIQMPDGFENWEAPVVVVLDESGNTQMVNFRKKDHFFIVDKLFDRAALILNSEGKEQRVEIARSDSIKGFGLGWKDVYSH